MCMRIALIALAVAGHLPVGCVSAEQPAGPADVDAAVIDRLLDEAAALREEGKHQSSWTAVAMALRIYPERPAAIDMWEVAEQERHEMVQQCLREARQFQLDRRYGESLRALERALQIDPRNPAVEALAEIVSDVVLGQSHSAYHARDSATTESGQGMRWVWTDDTVSSAQELERAIVRRIPRQRIHRYCEEQQAESVNSSINVKSSSMPIFLRDEDATLRGRLFEDDGSLGEVKWYAFSFGTVHTQALWAYGVWRDVGDGRWVLTRGLVAYDPAVSPASYAGAVPVGDDEDRYEDVLVIPGD